MAFNTVYKSLQELFPQIDARVLRAVAIEHSNDPDAAVGAVIEEIIPFFTEQSSPSSPLTVTSVVGRSEGDNFHRPSSSLTVTSVSGSSEGDNFLKPSIPSTVRYVAGTSEEVRIGYNANGGSWEPLYDTDVEHIESFHDAFDENHVSEIKVAESASPEQIQQTNISLSADVYSHCEPVLLVDINGGVSTLHIDVAGVPEPEGNSSTYKCIESCIETLSENISSVTPKNHQVVDVGVHESLNLNQKNEDFDNCLENDFGVTIGQQVEQGKSCADEMNSLDGLASLIINGQAASTLDSSVQVLPDMQGIILEKVEVLLSSDDASTVNATDKIVGIEYESTVDGSFSQSRQIHSIDVLEEIIADAKNNKKTLFSAMESVMSLMREVEIKEQAAEQAKEEAAMGGTDILDKAEELNKMLQHAKAANEMHSGEIYGEKAILATELRELQSRVLSLSDERDKSLAVLHEMRQTLEVRLTAAEDEIKRGEQEKLEKEKCAHKALAEQDLTMEQVVQESDKLKQLAEENAKLQEFLVDRGRVVDALQGEIAVICQDVQLMKEKFDEGVPFSKSLSSSQTSCKLASSSSSMRSLIPDQVESVPEQANSLETQNTKDTISTSNDEHACEDKASKDDRDTLLDEGWHFFDNGDLEA